MSSTPVRHEEGSQISGDSSTSASTPLYTWGDQKSPSSSKPVQKSRTRQPPTTLMVPNLIKVDRSSTSLETPGGNKSKDKTPTATGAKSKYQRNHRRNRTSESDSSKASSCDGGCRNKKDSSFEDSTPDCVTGESKLPSKIQSRPRKERSLDSSRRTTPKTPRKSPKPFEPYIPLEEVQRGLKKGELIEGILRINPKNYEDAYISAPDGQMDIYIGGILDRNRALHGDVVIVQIKPQYEWKVLTDNTKAGELKNSVPVANNSNYHVSDTIEILGTGTKKSKRGKRGKKKKKNKQNEKQAGDGQKLSPLLELDKNCEGLVLEPHEILRGVLDGNLQSKLDEDEHVELDLNIGNAVAPHLLSEVEDSAKEDESVCTDDLIIELTEIMNNNSLDPEPEGWGPTVPAPINSWCATNPQVNDNLDNSNIASQHSLSHLSDSPNSRSKLAVLELLKLPLAHKLVQKTAKVVYLKERKHNLVAVGHLKLMQDRNPNWALFSPQDHRLPRVSIPMKECPANFFTCADDFAKMLYIAKIVEWENTGFAKGHLYRSIGEAGLINTETEAILISNSVDYSDFPENLLDNLPDKLPWTIPDDEIKRRRDLRKEIVFTIDPETAKDLDDAVSCRELPDGTLEIGVHIADVSYFIQEGSKLDQVAASRATSVYLVQMVVPMLPQLLCEHLCSLNPGEDRLTMSVMWKMTSVGDILSEWFGRTVINSCVKLSYEQAQKMLDKSDDEDWKCGEMPQVQGTVTIATVASKVQQLNKLALILRKQRFDGGALCLNQVKLHFSLDSDTGLPAGFKVYEQRDSNRLIEEFMLLANMAVAHKILKSFPGKAVLRCHPNPIEHLMDEVLETFTAVGLFIDSTTAGKIQESLANFKRDDSLISQARQLVITSLLSKPMQRALYFCAGSYDNEELYHHYALNVPLYTHFTSPIRRYADILVHRFLAAALDYMPEPTADKRWLQRECEHCNDKKYAARICQESSQEIYLGAFIKESGPRPEIAMVIAVLDHSFDVLILQFGIIKRVYCDKLPLLGKHYQKQHGIPHLTLTWQADENHPTCAQTVTLFSVVTVMLMTSNEPLKIQAVLQRPIDMPTNFPAEFTVPKI